MPSGITTKPNDALSSGISHTSMSRDWSQSNQRTHRIIPDLGASGSSSRLYNQLGGPDSDDHLKVMMQTRVAVRDKTPHRFQIVPLREATNLSPDRTEGSNRVNLPTTPMDILHNSPSGKLGPCSQTRTLSHIRSLTQPCQEGREVRKPVAPENSYLDSSPERLAIKPNTTPRSVDHPHSRRILAELDRNQNTWATTRFLSKPTTSKSIAMRGLPSRDPLTSFSRTETFTTQAIPRASTGSHPPQDATLGTHISEISRLFSSENVASMRRNRSVTGSSIRSDTSVGMSDASHETEAKLKRRHAIYRESSCLPYLGQLQGKNTVAFDSFTHQNLVKGIIDSRVNKGINLNQDVCPADTSAPAHLKPPFELKQRDITPFTGQPRIPYLPNSGAGSLSVRALNLSKKKHVARRTSANRGETAHPQIVLDLLQDIDEEIAQWVPA